MKYIVILIIFLTSAICYGQEYTKEKKVNERNLNNDKLIHLQYEAWENDSTPTQVTVIQKEVEPSIFRRLVNDVPPPPPAIDYANTKLIYLNGNQAWRENVVLLMDGYMITDSNLAKSNANTIFNGFKAAEFWKEYWNNYNWIAVLCPSPTSGINTNGPQNGTNCVSQGYPLITDKNPVFGCTFNYGGMCRLLYAYNTANVAQVLNYYFPSGVKQTLIIANSSLYGGSGGTYATGSMHPDALQIMLHEVGHSYAKLVDEYAGGATFATSGLMGGQFYRAWSNLDNIKPNIDTSRKYNTSKFKLYLNSNNQFCWFANSGTKCGIINNCYEGGYYYSLSANNYNQGALPNPLAGTGAYPTVLRFANTTLMQYLGYPMYAINYEAHLYAFYSTLPTTKWLASSTSTTDTIKYPNYPTVVKQLTSPKLKEEWKVNGVVISNPATYTYPFGNSTITYTLKDTSWQTKNLQGNSPYVYNYYTLPTLTRTWNYKRQQVIEPPIVDAVGFERCTGDTSKGIMSASGADTYTWSPSTGLNKTSGSSVTSSVTITTTYIVTGYKNGLTSTKLVVAKISTSPNITVNNATTTRNVPVSLIANGGDNYTWSPSTYLSQTIGSTVICTPQISTTYTVTASLGNCQRKAQSIVTVNPIVIDSCKIDSFTVSSTVAKRINISFVPCKKSGVTYQVQVMKFTLAGVQQTGWTNKSVTYTTNTASKRIGSLSVADSNKRYDVRIVTSGKCVLTSNVLSVITK